MNAGKKYGIVLAGTPGFRARRIEAGLLSANNDFTSKTTPFEVGLGRFVDLEKDDFVGRSALLNSERKSKIWGLKVDGGIAVKGQNLSIGNKNIGVISSSTWSPYLECGVCIARFDKFDLKEGEFINVNGMNGEILKAEICSLPMYDKDGLILRGIDKNIPLNSNPWFAK